MRLIVLAVLALALSACGTIKTNEVRPEAAARVPPERVLAYSSPAAGKASFVVTRDSGFLGGGCFLAIQIDRTLAARFDTAESLQFYVKPGRHEVAVAMDPMGRLMCAAGPNELVAGPVREMYDFQAGETQYFRLSSRMYRRPELEPVAAPYAAGR